MYRKTAGALMAAAIALSSAALAAEPVERFNASAIWFDAWTGLSNATLKVERPDGKVDTVFVESGTPVYQLSDGAPNGTYRYELSAATAEKIAVTDTATGRENQPAFMAKPYFLSGTFTVLDGAIAADVAVAEE